MKNKRKQQRRKNERLRPLILMGLGFLLVIGAIIIFSMADEPQTPQASGASTPTVELLTIEGPFPEIKRVDQGDAKAAFDLKTAVFVDTREPDIFSALHIPGAINIPFEEVESRMGELDKSSWIITYCTWPAEQTSASVADTLIKNGYTQVTPLLGGFSAWVEKGYPTEP